MTHLMRFATACAFLSLLAATHASAQGECFPACRVGFVCSPSNECVSICNPPCGDGQICTAEAACIPDPAAQPVVPQQQWQPAPQEAPRQWEQPSQTSQAAPQWEAEEAPLAPPAPPSPLARPGSFRIHVQGYAGFAGTATAYFRGEDLGSGDLTATFGAQLQGLVPIGDFVLVGAALAFRSIHGVGERDRANIFSVDAAVGGHYAIALGDSLAIDPYVLFTLGLAIATEQAALMSDSVELGVDFGLRGGANFWFSDAVGVSFGLGYQRSDFYPDVSFRSENGHVRLHEFGLDLGLALRFGD